MVDAAALQSQNQKLVQQLEAKKNEVHKLEGRFEEFKKRQIAYDETLITVNKLWNQLVDDLILLELRLGGGPIIFQSLGSADHSRDLIPSCPPEETFLHRLLGSDPVDMIKPNDVLAYVQEALISRRLSTIELMKHVQDTISIQWAKTESLEKALSGKPSSEDMLIQLREIDDSLRGKANNLLKAVDFLKMKHKQYADEIEIYLEGHCRDQSEIKSISGELEESMAELEETRRKLINLRMQKDGMPRMNGPMANIVNQCSSPGKPVERTMGLQELKISVEEAKKLAVSRLSELQDAQEENMVLSKQLEAIKDKLKDEKYVLSSKLYSILSEQLHHLNVEREQYKQLVESLQVDRDHILRTEKELVAKVESANVSRTACSTVDAHIVQLKSQLEKCSTERAHIEIKLRETLEDAARKDVKDEIHVMASALSREMEMMEAQLNRCKEAAWEAIQLRKEAHNLKVQLTEKASECEKLSERHTEQVLEIKFLKEMVEKLEREKEELDIIVDMHGQECFDNRTISDIKDSEHRARMQADVLRTALDEHSLELRVRAANEAETACQQRLAAAEAEVADLRSKLDASERDVLELTEAIRVKDAEADAYISEIEAIGQAYEDMQVQNQHLLHQATGRDDCNIKLVSDSVRMKQAHSYLLAEKQVIEKKLQQLNASVDNYRAKIICGEEQLKALLSQSLKASSENRRFAIDLDKAKLELLISEKELKWLSSALASYEKEFKQNQQEISSMQAELEIERNERKRLEEELAEMKAEVDEMSAEKQEAAIQKLQDEIKECKAILKCGVCFDRPKEVVITKCFHLFCSQCIQRNLEIRHRRCPGCGAAFGQNDVREVNI